MKKIDLSRSAFYAWFKCPRCGNRTIVWKAKSYCYVCRKCNCLFNADFDKQTTHEIKKEKK